MGKNFRVHYLPNNEELGDSDKVDLLPSVII